MSFAIIKHGGKFSVVNVKKNKLHSRCSTLDDAQKQKLLLDAIENKFTEEIGGKINIKKSLQKVKKVVRFIEHPKDTVKFLTTKRTAGKYSPSMQRLLQQIGNEPITSIKVVRTPIDKTVKTLLDIISLGTYEKAVKESGYDNMLHLALFINDAYQLDKQAVVNLSKTNPITSKSEVMEVDQRSIPSGLTFNSLLDKTKSFMGDSQFSNYDSHLNNCQDFLLAILQSNGMLTDDLKSFIKQNADEVFRRIPSFSEKLAKSLTDIGAVADKVVQGGRFKINKIKHGKYEVVNINNGVIHSKSTTLKNAKKQVRLLNALDHGFIPVQKRKKDEEIISVVNKEMSTWREFWSKYAKGKKFGSRSAVNQAMKDAAKEWKAMKGKK